MAEGPSHSGGLSRWWRPIVSAAAIAGAVVLAVWVLSQPERLSGLGVPVRNAAVTAASGGLGPSIRDIAQRASDEGQVQIYWAGQLPEQWRQRFEAGYNQEFGLKVSLQVTSSSLAAPDLRTIDAAVRAGQAPPWDAMIASDSEFATLARDDLLRPREWEPLFGASKQAVLFDGGAVNFAQQIIRPAYNTNIVSPSSWEALLDPRWKGRLGLANTADPWVVLSGAWGDDRTTTFLQSLAGQAPVLAPEIDLRKRLENGSLDVVADSSDVVLGEAQSRRAPVAAADVQPAVLRSNLAATLRNARHPNAGILFAGFLLTQEGQKLWHDYTGQSSVYVDGSEYQRLLAGKSYALADPGLLLGDWIARQAKYGHILGL
jgi:iron(III) transport system substrate-binding protein